MAINAAAIINVAAANFVIGLFIIVLHLEKVTAKGRAKSARIPIGSAILLLLELLPF